MLCHKHAYASNQGWLNKNCFFGCQPFAAQKFGSYTNKIGSGGHFFVINGSTPNVFNEGPNKKMNPEMGLLGCQVLVGNTIMSETVHSANHLTAQSRVPNLPSDLWATVGHKIFYGFLAKKLEFLKLKTKL